MNFDEIISLRKAFKSVRDRQEKHTPEDFSEKIKRLKIVRELSVGNEGLLSKAIKKVQENGIKVFLAKDRDNAVNMILKEIGHEKIVVKSKSNVTKEINLTEELESRGIEVIETDIGDRILQVLKEKPSHPTGPIAHLSAKKISEGLSKVYGKKIGEDPEEIVTFMRKEIRDHLEKSRIGITGANAITAEEGSIVLVHNEGNIAEVIRKEKHIIISAIDKVYPTIEDAINMIKIITYNATGATVPSFIEIMSGVSKTADVEKKFFTGVHSPREVVLILLDNKRTEIIEKGFRELLFCIDCGNCLLHCPMYNTVGNYFAEEKDLGGKGLARHSLSNGEPNKKLQFCLTCGKCKESCPLSIDIPAVIRNIRSESYPEEAYYFLKSHLLWLYYMVRLKLWSYLKS
jgi:L-lactate dehydrogenase complex protein LldG